MSKSSGSESSKKASFFLSLSLSPCSELSYNELSHIQPGMLEGIGDKLIIL